MFAEIVKSTFRLNHMVSNKIAPSFSLTESKQRKATNSFGARCTEKISVYSVN